MGRRIMLNCFVVAMWLWFEFHGKTYVWLRRSHAFAGLIPHFGHAERVGLRRFRSIEYRPPKGRRWTTRDFVIAFDGHYLVAHYKLVAVRKWATKEQALADHYWGPHGKQRD